jgi:hypothetical protein
MDLITARQILLLAVFRFSPWVGAMRDGGAIVEEKRPFPVCRPGFQKIQHRARGPLDVMNVGGLVEQFQQISRIDGTDPVETFLADPLAPPDLVVTPGLAGFWVGAGITVARIRFEAGRGGGWSGM